MKAIEQVCNQFVYTVKGRLCSKHFHTKSFNLHILNACKLEQEQKFGKALAPIYMQPDCTI